MNAIVERFWVPPVNFQKFALPSEKDTLGGLAKADDLLDTFIGNWQEGRYSAANIKKSGFSRDMDHRQFVLMAIHHSGAHAILIAAMTVRHDEIADTYVDRLFEVAEMLKLYKRSIDGLHAAILEVCKAFEVKVLLTQTMKDN